MLLADSETGFSVREQRTSRGAHTDTCAHLLLLGDANSHTAASLREATLLHDDQGQLIRKCVCVCVFLKTDMSFSSVILSLPPCFSPSPPPVLTDMSKLSWTCQSRAEHNHISPHSPWGVYLWYRGQETNFLSTAPVEKSACNFSKTMKGFWLCPCSSLLTFSSCYFKFNFLSHVQFILMCTVNFLHFRSKSFCFKVNKLWIERKLHH